MKVIEVVEESVDWAVVEMPELAIFGKEYGSAYEAYEKEVLRKWIQAGDVGEDDIEEPYNEYPRNDMFHVYYEDHETWSEAHEQRLIRLIENWGSLSTEITKEVFKLYENRYQRFRKKLNEGDTVNLLLPDPSEDFVKKRAFILCNIHLSLDSEKIGISGNCVWDDEHGFGVLISKNNKVEDIGGADVAFDLEEVTK